MLAGHPQILKRNEIPVPDLAEEMKATAEEIYSLHKETRPKWDMTMWSVVSSYSPLQAWKEMPLGHILPKEGDSLSIKDPSGYYPDLGYNLQLSDLTLVECWAWVWNYTETDWARELDIKFRVGDSVYCLPKVGHLSITVSAFWGVHSSPNKLNSHIHAMAYAETGYEGHGGASGAASEDDMRTFYNLYKRIYAQKWVQADELEK